MKEQALALAAARTGQYAKLHALREYLQAYILRIAHDAGLFRTTAFVGGTALRFLHGLPRFSEDLDFSHAKGEPARFAALLKKIRAELASSGYEVSVSVKDEKTVAAAFIGFSGLLHEAGLTPHKNQKLSVKLELDTRPPPGAILETLIVNRHFPIAFLAYDLPSLLAGKLNALLCRRYTKGRDFFDLGWLLTRHPGLSPNIALLQEGLRQMRWPGETPDALNWRAVIADAVGRADWRKVVADAQNFLENPADMRIFSQENLLLLLKPRRAAI